MGICPCSRAREVGRCRAFAHGGFNSNLKMESQTTKEVLVKLGERNRVVKLPTEYGGVHSERELLLTEIRRTFADLLSPSDSITLQICDTSWGNVFVDFFGETIDNRAVFKLIVEREQVCAKRMYVDVDVLY